jgi:hypothetical protein
VPGVHRVAELKVAGGGVEVEAVGGGEGNLLCVGKMLPLKNKREISGIGDYFVVALRGLCGEKAI